jgi:hypothetical protein
VSEFDYVTERCVYCDGHWRHYCPCPYRHCAEGCTGSPHIAEPVDPDETALEAEAEVMAARWDDDPNVYAGNYSEE